jgi:hypothetical protein
MGTGLQPFAVISANARSQSCIIAPKSCSIAPSKCYAPSLLTVGRVCYFSQKLAVGFRRHGPSNSVGLLLFLTWQLRKVRRNPPRLRIYACTYTNGEKAQTKS